MDEPHVHAKGMDDVDKFIYEDIQTHVNEKYSFIQFEKGWTINVPKTLECLKIKSKS